MSDTRQLLCPNCGMRFDLALLNESGYISVESMEEVDYGWTFVCPGCASILRSHDDHTFHNLTDEEMWKLQESKMWKESMEKEWQRARSTVQRRRQQQLELIEENKRFRKNKRKK